MDSHPSRDSARVRSGLPQIVDARADLRFRALVTRRGLDPNERFVGGYVEWEWRHARHLFDVDMVRGRAVMELGCNVGATAIVLAALGADVSAVEPDPEWIEIARANAARYGVGRRIQFAHVPDTRRLPFADSAFEAVVCNSVLEYVAASARAAVLREIDRVLAPGGVVAVLGTSNRLWPREQHTRRWLVNYVPTAVDALWKRTLRRGISASSVRCVLAGYDDLLVEGEGRRFVELKARMGASGWKLAAIRRGARALARVGVSPGAVGPTLTMLLRKR
ncbi:Methyltransferase type 11 [Minicystis rosea]|nr:Methyltransferase type 11 [Minicystis rosea]